jgi:hypothetical protein
MTILPLVLQLTGCSPLHLKNGDDPFPATSGWSGFMNFKKNGKEPYKIKWKVMLKVLFLPKGSPCMETRTSKNHTKF